MKVIYHVEKVYHWDDRETLGYFTTEELAKKFSKKHPFRKSIQITKVELDKDES